MFGALWNRLTRFGRYGRRFEWCRPKLQFGLIKFGDDDDAGHWSLVVFGQHVKLWKARTPPGDDDGWRMDRYEVAVHPFRERYVYLCWNQWHKFIPLPWQMDWVSTEEMDAHGVFHVTESVDRKTGRFRPGEPIAEPMPEWRLPFRYEMESGEIQTTVVRVTRVERRTWQWRLFRKLRLPFMRAARTSLALEFVDEMGSERGSWKGGVIGVHCEYVPGESIADAVTRYNLTCNMTHAFCR